LTTYLFGALILMTASSVRSRASRVDTNAGDESSAPTQTEARQNEPVKVKKAGLVMSLKNWWSGLGLDLFTFLLMLK
jgi:hypothetical protein